MIPCGSGKPPSAGNAWNSASSSADRPTLAGTPTDHDAEAIHHRRHQR
jgi:hypothetical protein